VPATAPRFRVKTGHLVDAHEQAAVHTNSKFSCPHTCTAIAWLITCDRGRRHAPAAWVPSLCERSVGRSGVWATKVALMLLLIRAGTGWPRACPPSQQLQDSLDRNASTV